MVIKFCFFGTSLINLSNNDLLKTTACCFFFSPYLFASFSSLPFVADARQTTDQPPPSTCCLTYATLSTCYMPTFSERAVTTLHTSCSRHARNAAPSRRESKRGPPPQLYPALLLSHPKRIEGIGAPSHPIPTHSTAATAHLQPYRASTPSMRSTARPCAPCSRLVMRRDGRTSTSD